MASIRLFKKIIGPASHQPTWFLLIGYPLFWLDLITHNDSSGISSPMAWGIWILLALISIITLGPEAKLHLIKLLNSCPQELRIGFLLASICIVLILIEALKPIHLLQEFDCLQYHYALPRQHLILGTFAHIPWAADDLFLLPIDFALSPFWFVTALPNKIPQLIFLLGLLAISWRLTAVMAGAKRPWAGPLIILVILGTHGFDIQMGTAMLDLVIAYLFVATLDSLREGHWFRAGVEFTFFFWSKPLMPLGISLTLMFWGLIWLLVRSNHWKQTDTLVLKAWPQALKVFVISSLLVAGPFIAKSVYYAGTPLFPLAPGVLTEAKLKTNPVAWQSLNKASQIWMNTKNTYGHGHGFIAFIKHWWLLSVPEKGVNNAFDYPLGLMFLLLSGPFLFFFIRDMYQRKFSGLSFFVVISWLLWWFSVQQSRFLYVPVLLMYIFTVSRFDRLFKGLVLAMVLCLLIESVSFWGAYKHDLLKWGTADLRVEDQQLMQLNHRYLQDGLTAYVDWPSHDVAYAQFPVLVHQEKLPHTIHF